MNNTLKDNLKTLTILYIEDEDAIRLNLEKTLQLLFGNVFSVVSAELALEVYNENDIDIILSDINLPNMSGIELVQIIRKENHHIPIILLTAYTETKILLQATKLKLVSYLTKPTNFDELYTAFNDAVDEIFGRGNHIIKLKNNIFYDIDKNQLFQDDKHILLTPSETKMLNIFIKNINRTIPIQELKNRLWDDPYDASESAFKSLLSKLRKKIGSDSIHNISGIGYNLVLE